MAFQGDGELNIDNMLANGDVVFVSKNGTYTDEGDCTYGWQYGRSNLVASMLEDSSNNIYIRTFGSIEEAKNFVIPLRFFDKKSYVNDVIHVNEESQSKIVVAVKNVGIDLKSYIDTEVAQMDSKRQNYWYHHMKGSYKVIFRELNLAIVSILSQDRKFFDLPILLDPGVVLMKNGRVPCFNELRELITGDLKIANRSSIIRDLGETMDYFLTKGAIDMYDQLPWAEKMSRLQVPVPVAHFNLKCRTWGIVPCNEPVQWVLDNPTLWPIEETVEWIYRIHNLAKLWKYDIVLSRLLDKGLKKGFANKGWKDLLPKEGPVKEVLTKCEKVIADYEKSSSSHAAFEFLNIVTFYRDMFEHFTKNQGVGELQVYEEVEKYYVSIQGLCNTLRNVIASVFFSPTTTVIDKRWMGVMSRQFMKIVIDGHEKVADNDDCWK